MFVFFQKQASSQHSGSELHSELHNFPEFQQHFARVVTLVGVQEIIMCFSDLPKDNGWLSL